MIAAELTGLEEFGRLLDEAAERGAPPSISKGIRAGLKVIERAQEAAAPVGKPGRKTRKGEPITPGGLKRNIGSRFVKGKKDGYQSGKVGLNVGGIKSKEAFQIETQSLGFGQLRAYHAHLVALGTAPRWAGIKYGYDRQVRYGRMKRRGSGRIKIYGARTYNSSKDKLTGKPVRYRGVMPANDFIRTATAAAAPQAVETAKRVTLEAWDKELQKRGLK